MINYMFLFNGITTNSEIHRYLLCHNSPLKVLTYFYASPKDQPDLDLSAQECEDMFVDQWGDTWSDSAADTDSVIGRSVGDIHK